MDQDERVVQGRRPPTPSRVAISTMTEEWVELYRHVPPPGQQIHLGVQPLPVYDSIPEDKEIALEVLSPAEDLSGGLSVIQVERLLQWLIYATQYDTPDTTKWHKGVATVQAAFHGGTMS